MALRVELQKRIERKQAEIREHEEFIRQAQAYIQGLQDTLKLIPKEDEFGQPSTAFRHGSNVAKARDALRGAGRPLHISEILKAIGQPTDKKHRLALAGSIASYARKDQVFKKTAPNTFGLLEFEEPLDYAIPTPSGVEMSPNFVVQNSGGGVTVTAKTKQ